MEREDNIAIPVVGRYRAEEEFAALQSHGDPNEFVVGVIVAQAVYMLAGVIANQSDEGAAEQWTILNARIEEVVKELKEERQAKHEATEPGPTSDQ